MPRDRIEYEKKRREKKEQANKKPKEIPFQLPIPTEPPGVEIQIEGEDNG